MYVVYLGVGILYPFFSLNILIHSSCTSLRKKKYICDRKTDLTAYCIEKHYDVYIFALYSENIGGISSVVV